MYQTVGDRSYQRYHQGRYLKYNKQIAFPGKYKHGNDVVLYISGNEGAVDSSIYQNSLTDYDGLVTVNDGIRPNTQALEFANRRLELANNVNWSLTGDFTLEMWGKFYNFATYDTLFELGSWTNSYLFRPQSSGTELGIYAFGSNYVISYSFLINTWYHFVWQRKSGVNEILVSGDLVQSFSNANNVSTYNLGLGYSRHSTSQRMNGLLQYIRLTKNTALYEDGYNPNAILYSGDLAIAPFAIGLIRKSIVPYRLQNISFWLTGGYPLADHSINKYELIVAGQIISSLEGARFERALYLNDNSDSANYIEVINGANALNVGTGDYTIEFNLNHFVANEASFNSPILDTRAEQTNADDLVVGVDRVSKQVSLTHISTSNTISTIDVISNQYAFIQFIRRDGIVSVYVDRQLQAQQSMPETINPARLMLFRNAFTATAALAPFRGWIEDLRIAKTAGIPYSPIERLQASLLGRKVAIRNSRRVHQYANIISPSNDVVLQLMVKGGVIQDISNNNIGITNNGATINTTVMRPNSEGSIDTTGGSIITLADNAILLGSDDLTIDFWEYSPSGPANVDHVSNRSSNGYEGFTYYGGNSYYTTTGSSWNGQINGNFNANQWIHMATTRKNGIMTYYIQGLYQGHLNLPGSLIMTNQIALGSHILNSNRVSAQFHWMRIVKGRSLYNSNFIPDIDVKDIV